MKSCFEQLKENCINCNNSKMVDGDYCHTLRAYQQDKADGRIEVFEELLENIIPTLYENDVDDEVINQCKEVRKQLKEQK